MAGRIEDYALIGDMHTASLVGADGSVDWLCLPRFDSDAAFASLLGTEEHGFWRIGPAYCGGTAPRSTSRRYRSESLILESQWTTGDGEIRVTDFMPPRQGRGVPQLVRIVEGIRGRVAMSMLLRPRFGYGRVKPWVGTDGGRTSAVAGPDAVWLDCDSDLEIRARNGDIRADFTVGRGERVAFTLSWSPSFEDAPLLPAPLAALETTIGFWQGWAAKSTYQGPYREAVQRSLITLKGLTYAPTGGIAAAATTSLPEEIGGTRNWDYRYTWLRDAAFTLSSLLRTGHLDEARAWRAWLLRAVGGDVQTLQIMYGIAGERSLTEVELDWLPGYENSGPVRVGNGAVNQFQLDVYGEVADALYLAELAGLDPDERALDLLLAFTDQLRTRWCEPDEGIWEVRGGRRHFVHSKVMAWVAVDRTIILLRRSRRSSTEAVLDSLRDLRDTIHQQVCEQGYDPGRNTFTQSYGSQELDAALLLLPLVGFLPPDDSRITGTIDAIVRELSTADGLVLRYPTAGHNRGVDGLTGDEGAFIICSFWLVEAQALAGRRSEARALFERLLLLSNDVGLLAEEYDPDRRRLLGNVPQAFSHIGVVHAALALDPPRKPGPAAWSVPESRELRVLARQAAADRPL